MGKAGFPVMMSVCFWCGEAKEVLIGKRMVDNVEDIPRQVVANYDPCDKCEGYMKQGVTLIEATAKPKQEGQLPYGKAYPTGRWMVVRESVIDRIVSDPRMIADIKKARKTFLEPQVFDMLNS